MRRSALLPGLLVVLASANGIAQPAKSDPPYTSPVQTTGDRKVDAKAHYDVGITHYNLNEFDAAIAEFKLSYELSNAPGLLFNIAQSYRLKQDFTNAISFYRTYLRLLPDAPNRADVEARLKELEDNLAAQKTAANKQPTNALPPETDAGTSTHSEVAVVPGPVEGSRGGHTLKTAGLATAGVGVALVVTGAVFGHLASSAASDLDALNNGGTWTRQAQEKADAGKRDNTIAVVGFIAGGAAVATGATLYFLGRHKSTEASVAVIPTSTGASFSAAWQF